MKIQNQRSYAVTIGNLVVEAGETVDVPDEIGQAALDQPDNWVKPKSAKSAGDGEKENVR